MAERTTLTYDDALALATRTCLAAGADAQTTASLVEATLSAHRHGRHEVGLPHLVDYLAALKAGRLNGRSSPRLSQPFPAFLESDADGGIAQLGFDLSLGRIIEVAKTFGLCLFTQHHSFTTGELGYYVRQLADQGLISIAFTNAHALMTPAVGCPAVYSTNPMAFGFPLGEGRQPVVIDQSASATAFVNIIAAARRGEALTPGIAVDASGEPTTDAREALKGALLPFGGRKGANIALMVELMAAGLAGGAWSSEAKGFQDGDERLNSALTVIALMPGSDPEERLRRGAEHVAFLKGVGIHVPGQKTLADEGAGISLDTAVLEDLRSYLAAQR